MCGIAGIYAYRDSAPPVDREELLRIRDQMIRRGPDGAGLWLSGDGRVGLAHRRLAIIDLSATGAQPMASADGRYIVTFNGEIYNYRELRRDLEAKGFVFQSHSDTEVLLHLYADRGARMVDALRGMYAFAIQDNLDRALFLARGPFGIKPLYYADDGKTFRFASQVKALLAGGAIDTAPEPAGAVGVFVLGSVPEPFTLYRHIRSLPAGATLLVRSSGASPPHHFFDIRETLLRAQDTPFDPEHAQAISGKNRSDFMLETACEKAKGATLDQVSFQLDARKFKQFCEMLDAPARSNEQLDRLLAVKAPWGQGSARRRSGRTKPAI